MHTGEWETDPAPCVFQDGIGQHFPSVCVPTPTYVINAKIDLQLCYFLQSEPWPGRRIAARGLRSIQLYFIYVE